MKRRIIANALKHMLKEKDAKDYMEETLEHAAVRGRETA